MLYLSPGKKYPPCFYLINIKTILSGGKTMDYIKLKTVVGLSGACLAEIICSMLGGWDLWLKALVVFVILDYLSGVLAACIEGKLNSEIGYRGICKKVFIFILVAIAYQIDILFSMTAIRTATIGFYLATEGLSILENAGKSGLPLPDSLKNVFEKLKDLDTEENFGEHFKNNQKPPL
jgi:toxin secretion/phage lysis holin